MNKKTEILLEGLFGDLTPKNIFFPLGDESPIFWFDQIADVKRLLVRFGLTQEFEKLPPLPIGADRELRVIKQFMTGGTFEGREYVFCILIALFLASPNEVDGDAIVGIPARGAETLVQAEIKGFYDFVMKRLSRDATDVFEVKPDRPPQN